MKIQIVIDKEQTTLSVSKAHYYQLLEFSQHTAKRFHVFIVDYSTTTKKQYEVDKENLHNFFRKNDITKI